MNQRSEQFARFVAGMVKTKEYRRHVRWLHVRLWFYGLFHHRQEETE